MGEFSSFLPGKGFPPYAKRPILIQCLIEGIINGFIMDVDCILDEHHPSPLTLLILVVPLNVDSPYEDLLETIEHFGSKDIAFVVLF